MVYLITCNYPRGCEVLFKLLCLVLVHSFKARLQLFCLYFHYFLKPVFFLCRLLIRLWYLCIAIGWVFYARIVQVFL